MLNDILLAYKYDESFLEPEHVFPCECWCPSATYRKVPSGIERHIFTLRH
ncbi:MAG: hypothetical protein PVH03_00840 [Chloroflexota bacterium]